MQANKEIASIVPTTDANLSLMMKSSINPVFILVFLDHIYIIYSSLCIFIENTLEILLYNSFPVTRPVFDFILMRETI